MKKAIARILMFDLECPHCQELIETHDGHGSGHGSLSWSIHESVPKTVKCSSCGNLLKAPAKVSGESIIIDPLWPSPIVTKGEK